MLMDLGWERADHGEARSFSVLMVGDVEVQEGRRGPRAAIVKASLTTPSPIPLSVTYRTGAGTARQGFDFVARETTAVIPAGTKAVNLVAVVFGDQFVEDDETFMFEVTGFTGGSSSATGWVWSPFATTTERWSPSSW